jgi:glutamate synthase (NADPH/NADH) large chain
MSGGIGYFLDLDFDRLNTEMVDALPPSDADLELVQKLVTRHYEETDSAVAKDLLADWAGSARRFTKVLPRDYARVLAAREQAESEGLDEATTTFRMMEAAHG